MINNIQFLRGMAAILVVMYHIPDLVARYGLGVFNPLSIGQWGAFGVDVFFVISGYIMAMVSNKGERTPFHFIKKRFQRIFPLYFLLTATLILIQFIYPSVFREGIYSVTQNITSILFISRFFGYENPTLYVGWTLELEMFFYVIFFLTLFLKRDIVRYSLLSIAIVLSVITGVSSAVSVEFIYGVAIYEITKKGIFKRFAIGSVYFYISVLLCCVLAWYINVPIHQDSVSRPVTYGFIAFAMVFFAVIFNDSKGSVFSKLGDSSYSMYLTQVFSIPLVLKVIVASNVKISASVIFFLATIFVVIVGLLTYVCIERKINFIFKGKKKFAAAFNDK